MCAWGTVCGSVPLCAHLCTCVSPCGRAHAPMHVCLPVWTCTRTCARVSPRVDVRTHLCTCVSPRGRARAPVHVCLPVWMCVCTPLFLSSSSFSYELLVDLDQNFPEGQVREWGVNEGGKMAEGSRHPPGGPARGSERSPGQPARLPPAGGTSSSVETGEKLQARAWRFVLNLYPSCQRCSLEQAPENLREARFPRFPPL